MFGKKILNNLAFKILLLFLHGNVYFLKLYETEFVGSLHIISLHNNISEKGLNYESMRILMYLCMEMMIQ